MSEERTFALVTPAKDEVKTIGRTIEAVVRQTWLPGEWVIVSYGSTDGTDALIREACETHPWIRLLSLQRRAARCFAAAVHSTEIGIAALTSKYRYLGLLDADVTFQDNYFEELIKRFETDPKLGLAGGVVIDVGSARHRIPKNCLDVPGAVQFFRKECFDSLGGLLPVPEGGWDAMTARLLVGRFIRSVQAKVPATTFYPCRHGPITSCCIRAAR